MKFIAYKDQLLKLSLEMGATAAEVYSEERESSEIGVYEQEVDNYSMSQTAGLSLRVIYEGKSGSAYTEIYEDPEELVKAAIDNAKVITTTEVAPMQQASVYPEVTSPENPVAQMTEAERIEALKKMERDILAADARVVKMEMGVCGVDTVTTRICNTNGVDVEQTLNVGVSLAAVIVKEGEDVQNSFGFRIGAEAVAFDEIAKRSVESALEKLDGKPVPTGTYDIIFRNDALRSMMSAFSPMFSSEQTQNHMSLLENKEGQKIASDIVTIVDDPLYPRFPQAFDAEGTPSVRTVVVENGVLKSLLYNLKTAAKAGRESTSNAGRSGAAAPVKVAPTTFYMVPGTISFEELTEKLQNGLVITDVSGLHAGLNAISGSFSLLAGGYEVKDGKRAGAVNQITIAGDFGKLFGGIEAIADDLRFGPSAPSGIGAPSVLVRGMQVAGA